MANKRQLKKYMKNMAANLAGETVCKDSFAGDRKAYRKARNAYYKAAYKKLYTDFTEGVSAVLKDMNALLSKEQLEENKRMANE